MLIIVTFLQRSDTWNTFRNFAKTCCVCQWAPPWLSVSSTWGLSQSCYDTGSMQDTQEKRQKGRSEATAIMSALFALAHWVHFLSFLQVCGDSGRCCRDANLTSENLLSFLLSWNTLHIHFARTTRDLARHLFSHISITGVSAKYSDFTMMVTLLPKISLN